MNPVTYIETSVVSYLTSRPSRDLVAAAYQEVTREWWRVAHTRFHLVTSELVLTEVAAGDPDAVRDRLRALEGIEILGRSSVVVEDLTHLLLDTGAVLRRAELDAAHISIAAVGGAEYLVTWNFRHIANATMRRPIEDACRLAGYQAPVICAPNGLTEIARGEDETPTPSSPKCMPSGTPWRRKPATM